MTESTTLVVDWGTSSLRAWRVDAHTATEVIRVNTGVKDLPDREATTQFLIDTLTPHVDGVDAIEGVGMISSTLGIWETPYMTTPVSLDQLLSSRVESDCVVPSPTGNAVTVQVGPGVRHSDGDVMRGEELQALAATRDGVVVCPGSHSKWIELTGGHITRFSTYLSGELYAALSSHTALTEPISGGEHTHPDWLVGFRRGLESNPVEFSRALFLARAGWLADKNSHLASGFLSGLVLGMEWSNGLSVYSPSEIILIGHTTTTEVYSLACDHFGIPHTIHPDHGVTNLFRPRSPSEAS